MPVVIAHLSDLHLGAHDEQALASVVDDVAAARPDVTVVTGDLTMRARTEQFDAARRFLDRLPPPLVLVLGNHDIPLYDALERFGSPYDRYRDGVDDRLDPHLDVDGARILGLASMPRWRWKSGRVSERQAGLVTQVLGAAPAGALRVLAMHHPPSARGAARVKGRRDLRAAMVEARVDVVLAGHTHVPSTTLLRLAVDGRSWPVLEVVAGTATSHRTRDAPRSWALIEATGTTVVVSHREHRGPEWVEASREEFPRDASTTSSDR